MALVHPPEPMTSPVMILAAGRGERMRPLSDVEPKPLMKVANVALIDWTLTSLLSSGYSEALINTAWLGGQIREHLGTRFSSPEASHALNLRFSNEDLDFGEALETAGGIVRALPLLSDPFWVVAADAFCPSFDFDPALLSALQASSHLGHLWLVDNPAHNPLGDFCIDDHGLLALPSSSCPAHAQDTLTFSTIGIYKHAFFKTYAPEIALSNPLGMKLALGPILKKAAQDKVLMATRFPGPWVDVGTPERLAHLNRV